MFQLACPNCHTNIAVKALKRKREHNLQEHLVGLSPPLVRRLVFTEDSDLFSVDDVDYQIASEERAGVLIAQESQALEVPSAKSPDISEEDTAFGQQQQQQQQQKQQQLQQKQQEEQQQKQQNQWQPEEEEEEEEEESGELEGFTLDLLPNNPREDATTRNREQTEEREETARDLQNNVVAATLPFKPDESAKREKLSQKLPDIIKVEDASIKLEASATAAESPPKIANNCEAIALFSPEEQSVPRKTSNTLEILTVFSQSSQSSSDAEPEREREPERDREPEREREPEPERQPEREQEPEQSKPAEPTEAFAEALEHLAELSPELLKRFNTQPVIKGAKSIGVLVENLLETQPNIKIRNLYDITYEVDSVSNHRTVRNRLQLLVRWEGWSEKFDTWESESSILNEATPGLCLHICQYFLNNRSDRKVSEYLQYYITSVVLEPSLPDCLLLSRLSNCRLVQSGDRIIVPSKLAIHNMQRIVSACLKRNWPGALLSNFKGSLKSLIKFMEERAAALDDHERWRQLIQKKEANASIEVENLVDNETLPSKFVYITDYEMSPNVEVIPPLKHCKCQSKSCFEDGCCGRYKYTDRKTYRTYNSFELLQRACEDVALYECNSRCACDMTCNNRVTQRGIRLSLTIFRTVSRGWGIKTRHRIKRGSFIGEYIGEMMTASEAVARECENSAYLFDVKPFDDQESVYTIDGAHRGNLTRYFNHSCNPNMAISYVYIENHNTAAPRLAFFSTREIAAEEELTFNYNMQPASMDESIEHIPCKCGSRRCRKYLV